MHGPSHGEDLPGGPGVEKSGEMFGEFLQEGGGWSFYPKYWVGLLFDFSIFLKLTFEMSNCDDQKQQV